MEKPVVLFAEVGVPEQWEVRRVASCEEADVRRRGQLRQQRRGGGTAERRSVKRIDEKVDGRRWRGRGEFVENNIKDLLGLSGKFDGE